MIAIPAIQHCNKWERVGLYGALAVDAWGDVERGEFALFELGQPQAVFEAFIAEALARKLRPLGYIGIIGGVPETVLDAPLEEDTISALSRAYVRFVSE